MLQAFSGNFVVMQNVRIAYYSLFQSHLQYAGQLRGHKKKIKEIMQKLQNCVLGKNDFKKFHHSIKHVIL